MQHIWICVSLCMICLFFLCSYLCVLLLSLPTVRLYTSWSPSPADRLAHFQANFYLSVFSLCFASLVFRIWKDYISLERGTSLSNFRNPKTGIKMGMGKISSVNKTVMLYISSVSKKHILLLSLFAYTYSFILLFL